MSVNIKIVEEFPKTIFEELVERNLESENVFIRSWEHQFEGDTSFKSTGRTIRIGAFDEGRLIGLSSGKAVTKNRFMMHMSLIEEEYRNQGIYTRMLKIVIQETKEFDEIDSWHHIFNNRIISLKLRNGFHIISIDNSGMIGPRIRLRYYHNKQLLEIMKFRVGLRGNPVEISEIK